MGILYRFRLPRSPSAVLKQRFVTISIVILRAHIAQCRCPKNKKTTFDQAYAKALMGLASQDVVCTQQMLNIATRITNMTIDHDQASVAYEHLASDESILNEEHCKEIAAAIKASMASTVVAPTTRHCFSMQKHRFLYKYLPAELCGVLFSSETTKHKVCFLASFLVKHLPRPSTPRGRFTAVVGCNSLVVQQAGP